MHSSFLKKWFPHRSCGYTDQTKEKDLCTAYLNFIPHSSTRSCTEPPELSKVETPTHWAAPPPKYEFTIKDLEFSLYGKTVVQPIDTERIQRKRRIISTEQWEDVKRKYAYYGQEHDTYPNQSWSVPQFIPRQPKSLHERNSDKIDIAPSNAVMSFLPEVQLCMSSLPGGELGVCARREIPKDTVIGPYKGQRVRPEELKTGSGAKMSYIWEIYKHGKLDHYLDGSNENVSCWMRFIRSARNKKEQNLCAIQHGENIFYRTLIDIPVGVELLVWYEEKYEEYFGIPIVLHSSDEKKPSRREMRTQPLSQHTLRRGPFTPAMLKTMERTRLWIDERLGIPSREDNEDAPKPQRRNSCDEDSFPNAYNSEGEAEDMGCHVWKCSQCQQSFNQRSALRVHVCSMQTSKPFDCGHCSLSFADPNDLRTHVGTHTNDRLFKCGYCARRFAGATTLTNHIRTHTGEKPFSCTKCGKTFSQASQLCRHQRIAGDCV